MPLKDIPLESRRDIEQQTQANFRRLAGNDDPRKRCLYWGIAAEKALREHGYYACINGGTASWQANDQPEPLATHVGHFWQDLSDQTIHALFLHRGILPEMHCWAALPHEGVIFDPTTAWVKDLADESGIPWTNPEPPESFWCDVETLPDGWMYVADRRATVLAYQLADKMLALKSLVHA